MTQPPSRIHGAIILVAALGFGGCGSTGPEDAGPADAGPPPTDPLAILATLEDLEGMGEKRVGTEGGAAAGEYVRNQMEAMGLEDVRFESFGFPRWDLVDSSLALTVDGTPLDPQPGYDVFYGSGSGTVDAEVVWAGTGEPDVVAALDLDGRVAVVERVATYHRSSQYRNLTEAGAVAMLYISAAADNLRQVGTITDGFDPVGPIPAITVGAEDGTVLREALEGRAAVRVALTVETSLTPATGRNVLGTIPGDGPAQIVVGAHYDTWFAGSVDNGSGVAALLALAERRRGRPLLRNTVTFVGYDGEEIGLYGGYDFLRRHYVEGGETILAVVNLEMPSAIDSTLFGLARSGHPILDSALRGARLNRSYPLYADLEVVPMLFGGIIPTDIQGLYRSGVPTITTAVDSPYYHTTADTPDKVDVFFLAEAVDLFDEALDTLASADPTAYEGADPALWRATAAAAARSAGEPLDIDVTLTDAEGAAQADAPVSATLLYDGFFVGATTEGVTDARGSVTLTFDAGAADLGSSRAVLIAGGREWPLVEALLPID